MPRSVVRREKADLQAFVLRLDADLHSQLRMYAVAHKTSLNSLLADLVEKWWERNPERAEFARLALGARGKR